MSEYTVGLDFGASSIKVVTSKGDRLLPLKWSKDGDEKYELPNVICYGLMKSGKIQQIVGGKAMNKAIAEPYNAVSWIKRKLLLPNWSKKISCMNSEVTAWEVIGDILETVKTRIIERAGLEKEQELRAVLTVPVNFSTLQRRQLKDAAKKAGIAVEGIITEPFAAIFSMKDLFKMGEQLAFVFDFGASTLDISIVQIDTSSKIVVKELAAAGLNLGGVDIDEAIVEKIIKLKHKAELEKFFQNLKASNDEDVARQLLEGRLMACARKMKEELFEEDEDEIEDYIGEHELQLTKDEVLELFEKEKYKERIIAVLDELFEELAEGDDCFEKDDVTMILPFGGTSKISYFRELLSEYFEGKFDAEDASFDDDSMFHKGLENRYMAVAGGAVVYTKQIKSGKEFDIESVIPFRIGYEWRDKFISCIGKNAPRSFKAKAMPLRHNELDGREWKVQIYQSFSVESSEINQSEGSDDGAVYIATVQLNKKLYDDSEDVLMRMAVPSGDTLQLRFYQLQQIDGEKELAMIEEQNISIGG